MAFVREKCIEYDFSGRSMENISGRLSPRLKILSFPKNTSGAIITGKRR